jgi:3'-phosphoadenosine 5'-phosphosulfate sulfotransferase (PAPS reductase)/FAD synthetase
MSKFVASVSFGKDSLAMLLKVIEEGLPLDEVVFYDTGAEFNCIYEIRDKVVKELLEPRGIKFTELKPKTSFFETMFNKEVKHRDGTISKGYSWCGGPCRWGTSQKTQAINKYLKCATVYVGIAYDEPKRIERAKQKGQMLPLVDYGMTESDCLKYCYEKGFDWVEGDVKLYDILDRVSCWCCANKNNKELKAYYKYLPTYWNKLKELQQKTDRPFKNGKSIFDIEKKLKEADNGGKN